MPAYLSFHQNHKLLRYCLFIYTVTVFISRMEHAVSWFRTGTAFLDKCFFQTSLFFVNGKHGQFPDSLQSPLGRDHQPAAASVFHGLVRMGNIAGTAIS